MAHPVDKRSQTFRPGSIVNIAAFGTFRDQAGLLQGFEMLGDRALRYTTAPCQFDDGDLVRADDSLEYGSARGVSERAHDGIYVRGFNHGDTLAHANQLVNTNLF